jgi:hypothetical protein
VQAGVFLAIFCAQTQGKRTKREVEGHSVLLYCTLYRTHQSLKLFQTFSYCDSSKCTPRAPGESAPREKVWGFVKLFVSAFFISADAVVRSTTCALLLIDKKAVQCA